MQHSFTSVGTPPENPNLSKRDSKQVLLQPFVSLIPQVQPLSFIPLIQPQAASALAASGPCYTSKGQVGTCVPFTKCFPYFKATSNAESYEMWLLAMYDTCSYIKDSRQVSCCSFFLQLITELLNRYLEHVAQISLQTVQVKTTTPP